MSNERKYCGSGKFLDRLNGNNYRIYMTAKDLATIMENVDARGGVAIDFMERRQPDQYNNTHYLAINEYRSNGNSGGGNRQSQQPPQQQQSRYSPSDRPPRQYSRPPQQQQPWDPDDDIPF